MHDQTDMWVILKERTKRVPRPENCWDEVQSGWWLWRIRLRWYRDVECSHDPVCIKHGTMTDVHETRPRWLTEKVRCHCDVLLFARNDHLYGDVYLVFSLEHSQIQQSQITTMKWWPLPPQCKRQAHGYHHQQGPSRPSQPTPGWHP